ncbi:MAG TPA: 5'-3' exonuclease H3TH domain-containing protein [Candidatus Bathyarchaeia archaeon]|nr:5'-3' exonuclease H3TH domain-containing protein [Candidatus Bathyarchaeia archaeon]
MNKLVLIDGHAILHRAYHALPKTLTNRHGQLVNAVYGFTRMLLKVIDDLRPRYLAVVFDRPEPNFRHRIYLGYQAQRPKMDRELEGQIQIVKQVLQAFNVPTFEKIGFEADDLIGTLAFQAKTRSDHKIQIIIVTGDRDIFQLIDELTLVYSPQKGFSQSEFFDRKKTKAKMGVWPEQIIDYKALVGDASDNYPGIPGVGPKTAVSLLQQFKSLSKIYENLDKIKDSVRNKLIEGKDSALLSQKLATIETHASIKLKLKNCLLADYNQEKVLDLFRQLGFKSLMDKLPGARDEQNKEKRQQAGEQIRLV